MGNAHKQSALLNHPTNTFKLNDEANRFDRFIKVFIFVINQLKICQQQNSTKRNLI